MKWLLFFVPLLLAAEPLSKKKVLKLLDVQNPFVLMQTIKQLKSEATRLLKEAPYDTAFMTKYEKKEYPLSRSLYMEGGLQQRLQRGVQLGIKWRKATGTQEYNNIKTGADGEYVAQIELDLVALVQGAAKADIDRKIATLEVLKQKELFRESINQLYFDVLSLFNEAIALKQEQALLQKRLKRVEQIAKLAEQKFQEGISSRQDLLQLQLWVLTQRQKLLRLQTKLQIAKRTLGLFLNLKDVKLPESFEPVSLPPFKEAVRIALQERALFKEIALEKKQQKFKLQEAKLKRFGALKASMYGVWDVAYEKSGAKGTLIYSLPLQRSSFKAKRELAKIGELAVTTKEVVLRRSIKTALANAYSELATIQKEQKMTRQRVELLQEIVQMEQEKFREGVSEVFSLYQKMLELFSVQEELVKIYKQKALKVLQIEKEMGRIGRD